MSEKDFKNQKGRGDRHLTQLDMGQVPRVIPDSVPMSYKVTQARCNNDYDCITHSP